MSNYTEEEQIAQIKDWWSRNGKPLLTGGALALVLVFGWQYWQNSQSSKAQELSMLYQQLLEQGMSSAGMDKAEAVKLLQELEKRSADHAYTQYARLLVARVAVDEDRLEDASTELQVVVNKPANAELGEVARQRLARVLAADGKAEQALQLLATDAPQAFAGSRAELKGDLLVQLGRLDEARNAYELASDNLTDTDSAGTLMMKLDDLAQKDS